MELKLKNIILLINNFNKHQFNIAVHKDLTIFEWLKVITDHFAKCSTGTTYDEIIAYRKNIKGIICNSETLHKLQHMNQDVK